MIKSTLYRDMASISLKIAPNSSSNKILKIENGILKIAINGPPEKGKANQEVIKFLSKILDIKKSSIFIVQGELSRNKLVAFEDFSVEEIEKKINDVLSELKL